MTVFHVDEYVGLPATHPSALQRFLRQHFVDHVSVAEFIALNGEGADLAAECSRYAARLRAKLPCLAVLGIGENGHLAFNDPAACRSEEGRGP